MTSTMEGDMFIDISIGKVGIINIPLDSISGVTSTAYINEKKCIILLSNGQQIAVDGETAYELCQRIEKRTISLNAAVVVEAQRQMNDGDF